MKKPRKVAASLLCCMLSLSLLGACGQQPGQSTATTTAATTASAAAGAETTESAAPEAGPVALPLTTTPVTFKIWHSYSASWSQIFENLGQSEYYQELAKRTGVTLDFIHPTVGQEREALSLILASSDYPDIMQLDSGSYPYPGGLDKGIDDGVVVKLNDHVEKNMPNYKMLMNSAPDILKGSVTDTGNIAALYATIPGETQPSWLGPVVRQDWLDELGLSTPETYDDWHTMLTAFKEKKGATAPMMLYNTGFMLFDFFTAGYEVGSAFYKVDDAVKFGPLEDGYGEYLTMMNQWYSEGLVDPDFATKKDFLPSDTYTTTGKTGAWWDIYILLGLRNMTSGSETYRAVAVPSPAKTKGQALHLRQTNVRVGNAHWVVTTQCADIDLATKFIDYNYSEEGSTLAMYGTEGVTFNVNADGKKELSDYITGSKNPKGLTMDLAIPFYLKPPSGGGTYEWSRELAGQPEDNLQAPVIWGQNNDGAYYIPPTTMTTEEGTEYAAIMGDINTYISEMNVKFIIGDEPMTKFDEFRQTIRDMNIERALAIQQAAYDRYNARGN